MVFRALGVRLLCLCLLIGSSAVAFAPQAVLAAPVLAINTNGVAVTDPAPGGNGNNVVDAGETILVVVTLANSGDATATGVQGTLATATAGVTVATAAATYPDIPAPGTASNATAYVVKTSASFACGVPIAFTLTVASAGNPPTPLTFNVATGGLGSATKTSYTGPAVPIPDGADFSGTAPGAPADASLVVAQTGHVGKVVFSIDGTACSAAAGSTTVGLDHTFVNDLQLTLISPAGTSVIVINHADGGGNNFCQTILDDNASTVLDNHVSSTLAPFSSTWLPNSPLAAFNGDTIAGTWIFRAQDFFSQDTGNIRAWSLNIQPAVCAAPPAPTATTDTYTTPANTPLNVAAPGVLTNDISPSGTPLTAALVAGPAHAASFSFNANGAFAYTPVAGYIGPDSFLYTASDGTTTSSAATVNLTVAGTAAVAQPDMYSTGAGIPLTVAAPGVLANDTGVPAPTAVKVTDPAHGTVTLNADGSFTYTPTGGFVGTDTFTYSASNSAGVSPATTVTITVSAATLSSLAVTAPGALGAPPTIKVGQQAQLTATATLSDTSTPNVTAQSQWSSSAPAVASVDASGNVTGLSGGTATITASYTLNGATKTGAIVVTVGTPVLTGVQPAPAPAGRPGAAGSVGTPGPTAVPAPPARP